MSWACSGKELIARIERLGRSEMVSMSQCGFVLSDGHVRIAIDTVVSDLFYSGSDRSRRLVSPPFPVDAMPSLDAALVTHGHADHLDKALLEHQAGMGCRVIAPSVVLDSLDIPEENKIGIADYESVEVGDFRITAIPVPHMEYGESSPSHSISYGFLVVLDGRTLFHAGDTIAHERLASDLRRFFPIDYILLPINGRDEERARAGIIGNMSGEEAIAFTSGLGVHHLIPTHFDLFRENGADTEAFSHLAKGRIDAVIPTPGAIIRL